MSEEIPIWRQAIKDEQHPLNRAAWQLFGKDFDVYRAEEALSAQKDDVVGFCMVLMDARELYALGALGGGKAPANAVELLCLWEVEAVIPRLLEILEAEDWDTIIYGTTADSIAAFGPKLVDPMLELAASTTSDQKLTAIAGTLADAAPGDPRTIAFVHKLFDSRKQDFEIIYMAENVLMADPENGVKWLQDRLRTHKYSKAVRKKIERNIDEAKVGKF
jgi:hypothetical protein